MTTSIYRKHGGLSLPVLAGDVTTTLVPLDPSRDKLLNWFKDAINGEFDAAWDVVQPYTELTGTSPVATALPQRPSLQLMRETKTTFPVLALNREGRITIGRRSLLKHTLTQEWGLHYILGTLDAADERRASDLLIAVVKLVDLVIDQNSHPNHNSGAAVLSPDDFAEIKITGAQIGPAAFAGDTAPTYWAASITLQTVEVSGFADGADPPLDGVSIQAGTGNADGLIPNLINADTDFP